MSDFIKVTGLAETRMELRQIGERAVRGASRQMHRTADRVVEKAKQYVPEDSGLLKESIRAIKDNQGINGRLQIDVVMGGGVGDRHGEFVDQMDVTIDQYAMIIHENYENYEPGPRTLKKMAGPNGDKVGSKFLTRAAEEEEEKLKRRMYSLMSTIEKKGVL